MKKNIKGGLLAALTVLPLSFAAAQEVDEIIVSATGIPTPAAQIGASVDVITAADLEAQQITYLQDALSSVAGISTYSSGGKGSTSNVFMRGMTGKYSGVYVDGIQINDPASQQAAWAHLPTHGLEKVEVLRGSQGVLYGSEAIGGAISLFTAYGGETVNEVSLDFGSFGTQNLSLSTKGETGNIGYGFFIQHSDTDGISAANEADGNTEEDGYESLTARGRFVMDLSEQLSLDFAMRSVSSEVETDTGAPVDATGNYTDFDAVGGRLGLTYEAENSRHTISFGESEDISSAYSPSAFTTEGAREAISYRGIFEMSEQIDILVGYEKEEESYTASGAEYIAENEAFMALLQYSDNSGFSASFAMRQDDNEEFGKFDTSRLAGKKMFGQFGLRASYGTGFRAPSLYELYGLSDYCAEGVCGNTALSPEESRGRDVALVFEPNEKLNIELAQFNITVSNFIKYGNVVADASDPCRTLNFASTCGKYEQTDGESESSGYELRGVYQYNSASKFTFNFSKLDANNENGKRDIRRPEESLNLALTQILSERLTATLSVKAVRDVIDTDFSDWLNVVDVKLDDYTLLNLSAAYQINDRVKAYGRIENATDEEYETVLGYGTPGQAAYIGVTTSF